MIQVKVRLSDESRRSLVIMHNTNAPQCAVKQGTMNKPGSIWILISEPLCAHMIITVSSVQYGVNVHMLNMTLQPAAGELSRTAGDNQRRLQEITGTYTLWRYN